MTTRAVRCEAPDRAKLNTFDIVLLSLSVRFSQPAISSWGLSGFRANQRSSSLGERFWRGYKESVKSGTERDEAR